MPRILVADDNSNIQKMVTLALKDIGIDVVAVPNGEAAVRKLTDANLDLVLADIFMPVRSGYEVCEYIKHDSRYSHLPVILLVGAFDPLDEREAQRVGADGILKKPFVPPDPLINMIKGLLAKSAAEKLAAVTVPAEAEAHAAPPVAQPETAATPKAAAPDFKPPVAEFTDAAPEEFMPPPDPFEFGDSDNPIAFSNLLDAPASDDRDLVLTAHRDPSLGEPAWSHPPAATTGAAAEETTPEEDLQDHTWGSRSPALDLAAESTSIPLVAEETENLSGLANEDTEEPTPEPAAGHAIAAAEAVETPLETVESAVTDHSEYVPKPLVEAVNGSSTEQALQHVAQTETESAVPGYDFGLDAAEIAAMPAVEAPAHEQEDADASESSPVATEQSLATETPVSEAVTETQKIEPIAEPEEAHEALEIAHTPEAEAPTGAAAASAVDEPEHPAEVVETHAAELVDHHEDVEAPAAVEADATHSESAAKEFPAWMASAATIFPAMKPLVLGSVEHSFASEVAALSEAHAGTNVAVHPEDETEPVRGEISEQEVSTEHNLHSEQAAAAAESAPAVEASAPEPAPAEHETVLSTEAVEAPAQTAEAAHGTNGATITDTHTETPRSLGSGAQSPEMIEAIVSRIVDRMQPKIFEVVTNEILRPLVEAMVRREMDKE